MDSKQPESGVNTTSDKQHYARGADPVVPAQSQVETGRKPYRVTQLGIRNDTGRTAVHIDGGEGTTRGRGRFLVVFEGGKLRSADLVGYSGERCMFLPLRGEERKAVVALARIVLRDMKADGNAERAGLVERTNDHDVRFGSRTWVTA